MEHPEELSKVAGLRKQVDEVKSVMVDNIEQVSTRPRMPGFPLAMCFTHPVSISGVSLRVHQGAL